MIAAPPIQGERGTNTPPPKKKGPPRRISVERRPGLYYRLDAKGRRIYEVSYTDSDGRRRWKSGFPTERAALAWLEDVRARVRKGERVSPTRKTVAEVADLWLAAQTELRPRTRDRYQDALGTHIVPRLGRLKVSEVTVDHVAWLIADMRRGRYYVVENGRTVRKVRMTKERKPNPLAGWTIRATLTPLSRLMAFAVRRGWAAANPVKQLDRGERPSVGRREMRVLEPDEIRRLLAKAGDRDRALLATAVFTGMRLSELLGLTWADVDFDAGVIHVRKQLALDGSRVEPKTPEAVRDVDIMAALGTTLREHWLASDFKRPTQFVFSTKVGTPRDPGNVSKRTLAGAVKRAKLDGAGRPHLRFHDLRHTAASLLIAEGLDVVYVSRQLGHADPAITLKVYAKLFDRVRHAEKAKAALEARYGGLLERAMETTDGDQRRQAVAAAGGEIVQLRGLSD